LPDREGGVRVKPFNSHRSKLEGLAAFAAYTTLAVVCVGWRVMRDPFHVYIGRLSSDPTLFIWFLKWWPFALTHGLNPFLTDYLWAPTGINLAWMTPVPGASLLAWPITASLGPVAAYNIVALLALPLAAWTAYLLCRHITGAFLPALLAGYVFGFSSYEWSHLLWGHLNLILVFPVPLLVYLLLLRLDNRLAPFPYAALMAVGLIVQFSFSVETFATMSVFGGITALVAFLLMPGATGRVLEVAGLTAAAYVLAALVLSPYLYFFFSHALFSGPVLPLTRFSSDLLNFVVPTPISLASHLLPGPGRIFSGNISEGSAFLGLPVLAIIILFAWASWRTRTGKLLLVTVLVICIASLGPTLHLGGSPSVPLPWRLFLHLPLINIALPGRFMGLASLAVATIVALWLASGGRRAWLKWALAALSIAVLLPNVSRFEWTSRVDTPAFFAHGLYRRYIPPGSIAFVLPYGELGSSMLWQAQTGMEYRMAEGSGANIPKEFTRWPVLDAFACATLMPDYRVQLRAFLSANRVQTVVVVHGTPGPWGRLFDGLGVPIDVGGVRLYKVPGEILAGYREATPLEMVRRAALAQFSTLLRVADAYLSRGFRLSDLTIHRVEQLGLLPNWGCAAFGTDAPGTLFWQHAVLRLGPGPNGTIGLGILGSSEVLGPVIEHYAMDAQAVYFPYPSTLSRPLDGRTAGMLVMFFTQAQMANAVGRMRAVP